ncbi:MAG: glycoside hydrolase [Thermoleophilia bacterium]|nr:glycoside hydrolase [Thermoleophilia bacterium]
MPTSEPLNVAFVWHMHQPDYRSALTGAFEMPWVRLHAIKDYLDMVETLAEYPRIHATFNLVPCLVEQLEDYVAEGFRDVYWEHTLRPAAELAPAGRSFVVERMCERPDHPRARSHSRYLELAEKRFAHLHLGWEACARAFTTDELRDLQVWFNLAWFDPEALARDPLRELVDRGKGFTEADKQVIAAAQADLLARTLPAYQDAARRGQVELTTSPYYHPILPLLANSDAARVSAPDTLLPPRRFAHPEDAAEQIESALAKHEQVFGERPSGMWCSEQAVGEDVVRLLIEAGLAWTISDETVLSRSVSGAAGRRGAFLSPSTGEHASAATRAFPYAPCRLEREQGKMAIVFRDHTLSDLIGFTYRSWDSRDAAADLLRRLAELRASLATAAPGSAGVASSPLVTIALDGENAWEYYPRDGRDFLRYLYEGLSSDDSFRCVTVSEHLCESPPDRSLDWLHTGSWIGGDLRTWSGDRAHNTAWDLMHQARDLAASRRSSAHPEWVAAWRHVLIAEGSDWFWWFGDHHHTELDHVWDRGFRLHLQEIYRRLGEPVPTELLLPILEPVAAEQPAPARGGISPAIDGLIDNLAEWDAAGRLVAELPSTMQPSNTTHIAEVRFGWHSGRLCVLVAPALLSSLAGLDVEIRVTKSDQMNDTVVNLALAENGRVEVSCTQGNSLSGEVRAAYEQVLETSLPLAPPESTAAGYEGLVVRIVRGGLTEHVFHSAGLASIGWGEQ